MKRVLILRLAASLVATATLGGCTSYWYPGWHTGRDWYAGPHWYQVPPFGGVAYAGREPPEKTLEVIPLSPGVEYVWVGGHWRWRQDDFEWVQGRWARPVSGAHEWVPGAWDFDEHGWYYVDGYWR